ncbi:single-stranded-DNA-specific exonuclease RecJ [Croceicoccus sp. F390]|uniref:Single-stranded-DNA-specific exonuclease RecJ n=1 Tax=Croceicoccus esteveae TaxID=3075597 RepID=A0ABU2ZIQ8_9SPHN|nr:single-stranded-DNA-specific exonuclease RecJ [Croceicoccus sp. F390]MDT0575459.1 single-stranded-DNA-specific exonuclease RecJ [Croceicoccus sp. F390]
MTNRFSQPACGVTHSLSDRAWRWRGGNMDGAGELDAADLVSQLLLSRGVSPDDLLRHRQPTMRGFLPDPSIFADMDAAAQRLADALTTGETVTIYGDYDVDGATSAALLIRVLRMLGGDPGHYIPDRLLEGYGPSGEALVRLGTAGSSLIVTVDCGAMAYEALEMAHDAGIDVIVVDHHKCASVLPRTAALVNPNRLDETGDAAAHGHLAAVGVAFLLAVALVRHLRASDFFKDRAEPDLMQLLDLVALGTVADVAALHGLNRAFVAQGLKVMAQRRNIGIAALLDASGVNRPPICSDLGFALGPRINAGGRVGEATLGVRLLTTQSVDEAADIARRLDTLNQERRAIEAAVQHEAEAQLGAQHNRAIVVVAGHGWHPGVIGIVAGRIKEQAGRPAIVIALDAPTDSAVDEPALGKGSGRSISGVDLGAAVIAAQDRGLLVQGGGHAMAAGMIIRADKLEDFRDFLDERLGQDVERARGAAGISVDLSVAPRGLRPDLVTTLESAGPFGMGWPAPKVAVGPVTIVKADVVGNGHVRIIASGADGGRLKAIAFRAEESRLGQTLLHGSHGRKLWLLGRAKIDDWGRTAAAELHLDDAAFAE